MDAFLASTVAVAIAEIGDKTQLLSLFMALTSLLWTAIIGIVASLITAAIFKREQTNSENIVHEGETKTEE